MKTDLIVCAVLLLGAVFVQAAETIYSLPLKDIDGKSTSLDAYKGKVLLIVNVASKCGYTPQYTGLEALQQKYGDKGFVVLGFPCNQFRAQEPGTAEEIKQFCSSKYHVTFPLFEKIEVNGPNRHPLYLMLAGKESPFAGDIRWNFTKFLVGRDGKVLKRFEPGVTPDSAQMVQAIESALAGS
jgi:glutathione peroxidase